MITDSNEARDGRTCAYRVLRYTPNPVRDEWVNIGVLVFDPRTGERRLRMIEEPEEYARVRRGEGFCGGGGKGEKRFDNDTKFFGKGGAG